VGQIEYLDWCEVAQTLHILDAPVLEASSVMKLINRIESRYFCAKSKVSEVYITRICTYKEFISTAVMAYDPSFAVFLNVVHIFWNLYICIYNLVRVFAN
jgi:hypothetical protein